MEALLDWKLFFLGKNAIFCSNGEEDWLWKVLKSATGTNNKNFHSLNQVIVARWGK
ncbi:MAG: hypothetical protein AB8H47_18235 [Bacteroidia bacterium]